MDLNSLIRHKESPVSACCVTSSPYQLKGDLLILCSQVVTAATRWPKISVIARLL